MDSLRTLAPALRGRNKRSRIVILACLLLPLLSGCATLPPLQEQQPSVAISAFQGTALADLVERSVPTGGDGFRLLIEPHEALDARIALVRKAQRSLDLQYFIWNADRTGRTLLVELREAAARGVRVRLLLDDLYTSEIEAELQALTGYALIEVRLFNPFPAGRGSLLGRLASSLGDFRRIRHRMHNKLLVADNAVAITGGRNIGDAYLARGEGSFFDVDVLAVGPVVREMSESFDDYWNSDYAYEGRQLWGDTPASDRRDKFDRTAASLASSVHERPQVASSWAAELSGGHLRVQHCKGRLFADPVEKVTGTSLEDSGATLHQRVIDLATMADKEVVVVSPYFVRGQRGLERLRMLRERGIRLRLLTNSGAATDEPLAHAVYLRYRQALVRLGLEIREFSAPSPADREEDEEGRRASASRLHAKLGIVDDRFLYVGSLNFTGRSERINTELGLILDCPELASQALRLVEAVPAYQLRLTRNGAGIEWVDYRQRPPRVWQADPELSWWQQLKTMLFGPLVPENEI